jgi:hypothetical protein
MAKETHNNKREFKIPDEAKKLAKLTAKKFKKENKDYYDSKKEMKQAYYSQIIDLLPESIALCVKYGHLADVKETKEAIYAKIMDPGFIKYLKKEIKDAELSFDNLLLLPAVINDIVKEAAEAKKAAEAEDPDKKVEFDLTDLVDLSHIILKKKIKKMTKAGIDENVAFDVLSVIPSPKILSKSQYFHIRSLFNVLYEHAKTKEINFEKLMKVLFKDEDTYIPSIITFALLERKEKITNFTDSQKKLFNDITEYCFKTLEEMKKEDIYAVLKSYCDARKRDEAKNHDTNRRYYISSLPESDYPKITKTVNKMVKDNENMKKYF